MQIQSTNILTMNHEFQTDHHHEPIHPRAAHSRVLLRNRPLIPRPYRKGTHPLLPEPIIPLSPGDAVSPNVQTDRPGIPRAHIRVTALRTATAPPRPAKLHGKHAEHLLMPQIVLCQRPLARVFPGLSEHRPPRLGCAALFLGRGGLFTPGGKRGKVHGVGGVL